MADQSPASRHRSPTLATRLFPPPRRALLAGLLLGPWVITAPAPAPPPERILPNSNLRTAGHLSGGVFTLNLEARTGSWYPSADSGPGLEVQAFGEAGGALQDPGPLIRVPAGTVLHISLRNRLASPLVVHGLTSHLAERRDSVVVAPGTVRQLRFRADAPGTYYYWGSTTGKPIDERDGPDSQLSGALIVDPPGTSRPPTDRVFVLGVWFRDADSTEPHPTPQQDVMVINGKSWPYTERIGLTQGDTVRWRWINPTAHSHPMHLHGFYFQVESRGDGLQDTLFAADSRPFEVTELMLPGGTMAMNWSPVRAGNWLFHCHFSFHISPDAGLPESSETAASTMAGPAHRHRMSGLVLGLQVKPRPGATAPHEVPGPERQIRLLVQSRPRHFGSATGFGYVLPEGTAPVPHDSIAIPGPMLLLHRDEPVRITVVNHLDEFTAVHWHGIELQSFPDGVPGWSGSGSALLSPIAPGDSFAAEFTPPRSGTFIYHTHANEMEQMTQGLYGPLVVLDPGEAFDSATDHVVIASPDGESTDTVGGLVNGSHTPAPIVMRVGEANRIRLINIHGDYRVLFSLLEDGRALTWRPLAKDGASVAPGLATPRPARLMTGPGETADFEVRFDTPGERALEVEAPYADRIWKVTLPIRVEAVKGQ